MSSPSRLLAIPFALVLLLLTGAGCGKKIGDGCRVSDDCVTTQTDRQCDNAQPGGYCTIVGCDERTCPEDSTCVRFYPAIVDTMRTCDANPALAYDASGCTADELCLRVAAGEDFRGVCVPRASERRFCVQSCNHDSDCRGKYECRTTAEPHSKPYTGDSVEFCAPKPTAQ